MPTSSGLLLNPNTFDPAHLDPQSRRQLRALIDWFEDRGKIRLLRDDLEATWVSDFLDFVKRERIFATFLTPSEFADGDAGRMGGDVVQQPHPGGFGQAGEPSGVGGRVLRAQGVEVHLRAGGRRER